MFCSKCGKELPEGVRFCPDCGAAVNRTAGGDNSDGPPAPEPSAAAEKTATAVKDKTPKRRGGKALLVAVPLVAVLIAAAVFLLPRLLPSPADSAAMELLRYIDQAEELNEKTMEEFDALRLTKEEDGDIALFRERTRAQVDVLGTFLTELAALQEQANALSGLDAKLQTAGAEYFNMLQSSRATLSQTLTFWADYFDFYDEIVACRPLEVDFDSIAEYSESLSQWTQETRAGYAAISCPMCMESEWKQYGEILEYNESIAEKVNTAVDCNDWLRYYSAKYMTDRYITVESTLYEKFLEAIEGEQAHAIKQRNVASDLAKEIHTYAELPKRERDAYTFEYVRTGKIWHEYDAVETIYPSLYNTYDAFVILKAGCISGNRTIVVEAEIPGFTQKYVETFHLDSSYRTIYIKPPALTGELDLSAAKDAQISVTLSEQDGTLIEAKSFPVSLKSKYDFEWYSSEYGTSTKDNILCFLTPESSAITELKRQAIDEITDLTDNRIESFVGYQNAYANWNQYMFTYLQTAGLMSALRKTGVRYNMDPFSISGSNQHILLPADVIAQKSGLCVETSLTIASALQSAGMHAFLLFPRGHAQVAVEVWNEGDHKGEYFLIETTQLGSGNNREHFIENANAMAQLEGSTGIITYWDAPNWYNYLENEVEYIIDCDDSRLLGLTPFAN